MTIFGDPLWSELLSVANIAFGLIIAYASFRRRRHVGGFMRWGVILLSGVGMYWAALYTLVLLTPAGAIDSVWFGRIFFRPALTMLLWIIAGNTLYRYKTEEQLGCNGQNPN